MLGFVYPGQTYPAGYPFVDPLVHRFAPTGRARDVPLGRQRHVVPAEDRNLTVPPEDRRREQGRPG